MNKSPFAQLFNIISTLAAIIGIITYFINPAIAIVCGIISFLNSLVQIFLGDQNNLTTEIITIILAVIIALIIDVPIFTFICFALCAGEIILLLLGWILLLFLKF